MKTNKKILLEFLPPITYLLDEAKDLSYREFLDAVNEIVWNVEVSDEIENSKNLTDDDKEEINYFLSSIQHYFYKLKDDISKNALESLNDEVNNLLEYCKDETIGIVYENDDDDYENNDDNDDDKTIKKKEK
ncbi:hypothetical protein HGD80_03885 [Paulownia witches'-broom phytoplasma]|uniref:Uncharacterized protein n=1 Tax=Paulownia witches'-broom phytoplasma TaxID=39647 RepID=A0ABX8TNP5_9MOLU|nr:hypothetical protein [Paulownia witches'-broom phytoplasma]QYC30892.1 hypothetical protein HGD80_03885 [Paulownia witches'-broom phytoplasma]